MSKAKQDKQFDIVAVSPPENPLAVFGGLVDQPLAAMVEPEGRSFLPFFKLPYGVESLTMPVLGEDGMPLMNKGQPVMQSATGHIVISAGKGKITPLAMPYILTAISIRGATRETVEKEGQKTYVRTLAPVVPGKAPSEKHTSQVARGKQGGVDVGNTVLAVALLEKGTVAVVGLMECFKTLTKYWVEPLKNGLLQHQQGIVVTVEDHTVNYTKSNNGFDYYDSRKFTQWKSVGLPQEQVALACAALKEKEQAVNAWLKKEE